MPLPPAIGSLFRRILPAFVDRAFLVKATSFALIGCVNVMVDFGVFSLGYFYLGLPIVVANVISWCIAVSNSYVLNSMFTFARESGRRLSLKAYLMFVTAQVGGLVANTATLVIGSKVIPLLFGDALPINPILIAKVLAIGASFVVDFTLSYLIVFRRHDQPPPHRGQQT